MKNLLLIVITLIGLNTTAQNINIPDANFKKYLVGEKEINTNGDSEISLVEAKAFNGGIYLSKRKTVKSLKGIEYFTSITDLNCENQDLVELEVSKNTKLNRLNCRRNSIQFIDVSKNLALIELDVSNNKLKTLDVINNQKLNFLDCYGNNLSSIDLSKNHWLERLSCSFNQLTSLDISNNTYLEYINYKENNISILNTIDNIIYMCMHYLRQAFDIHPDFEESAVTKTESNVSVIEKGGIQYNANSRTFTNSVNEIDYTYEMPENLKYESHFATENRVAITYSLKETNDTYLGVWNHKLEFIRTIILSI